MSATIEHESGNIYQIRATGLLQKSELEEVQSVLAREIDLRGAVRLLFVLEHFDGWERGADWGDTSFYTGHGRKIERIAIVGAERWQDQALMFAGAGVRMAPVRYFGASERSQANAWLALDDQRDPSPVDCNSPHGA